MPISQSVSFVKENSRNCVKEKLEELLLATFDDLK